MLDLDAQVSLIRAMQPEAKKIGVLYTTSEQNSVSQLARLKDICAPLAERIQPPVEQWLRGFMDAEFVVTDSFHACVFSILFGKPFIAIGNAGRGLSRFTSLLGMLGLESRLAAASPASTPTGDIDWPAVSRRLAAGREEATAFLTKSI